MKWTNVLKLLIGPIIITLLVYHTGINEVYLALSSMNLLYIPLILALYFLSFFSGALSLKMLTLPLKNKSSITRLYQYTILVWGFGLFVPGKIGDLSMIYFLKREGIEVGQATFVTMTDRLVALVVLSVLSILGFFSFFEIEEGLKLTALLLILVFSIFFWVLSERARGILKKYVLRRYSMKFKGFSKTLNQYRKNHKKILLLNFFIILSRWVLISILTLLAFISFGYRVSLISIIFICAMTTILSLVPVTLAGLGVREVGAVFLYSKVGVPPPVTIGVHIVLNILNYVVAVISITILAGQLKSWHVEMR